MAIFWGAEMNDDTDAAVEHKENAISHQMKIPHHPKIKWPLLKAHAKHPVMPHLSIFLAHKRLLSRRF